MKFKAVYTKDISHWEQLLSSPRATRRGPWDWKKTIVRIDRTLKGDLLFAAVHATRADLVKLFIANGATARGWSKSQAEWALRSICWDAWSQPLTSDNRSILVAISAVGINPFETIFRLTYSGRASTPFELAWKANADISDLLPHNDMDSSTAPKRWGCQTALHRLALSVHPHAARVTSQLCAAGANMNLRDVFGDTPLDDAIVQNNRLVARALLRYGGTCKFHEHQAHNRGCRFVPWSRGTHHAAPPDIRAAIRALYFSAHAKHGLPRLPPEMISVICGWITVPWVDP